MTSRLIEQDPEFQRLLAESEARRFEGFTNEVLAWLALPPRWPVGLARYCGSPDTARSPEELLEQAAQARLVRAESIVAPGGRLEPSYQPSGTMRARLLERAASGLGRTWLRDMAVDLASRMQAADPSQIQIDRELATWAAVASRAKGDSRHIDWMYQEIDLHVAAGRTPLALELIEAAESLAPILGEPFPSAARRGRRRLGMHYRRLDDERFLRRYLPRPELITAYQDLMATDDYWALHYVGMGGVGKTMLIRSLASRALDDLGAVVARIDFDHIDPRYPATNPGELLRILGEELVAHAQTPESENRLAGFRETMDRLASVDARDLAEQEPLAGFDTPEFEEALVQFTDFVAVLGKRVVFFLDTCEELAKLHPAAIDVPGIEGTFRILEDLRDRLFANRVDLRVVLAGRRLLASRYRNFTPDLPSGAAAPSMVSLRDRSAYLAVAEIRGFTAEETDRYVVDQWGLDLPEQWHRPTDDGTIRDVVLARSRETGRVAGFDDAVETDIRYNPFDLYIYADWLKAGLTDIDQLAEGPDPYVQVRIVERFRRESGILDVLPAACLLGRFEATMLVPALTPLEIDADSAMHALAEQEWVNASAIDGTQWLEVEPRLLPRIRSYLHTVMPGKVETARELLVPALVDRATQPIGDTGLRVEHVDAALRLTQDEAAARIWSELVTRAAQERQLGWLGNVCELLLGRRLEWETGDPEEPAARDSVWAGVQAAQLHLAAIAGDYQPAEAWQAVLDRAGAFAYPQEGWQLALQARFAQVASGRIPVHELDVGPSFEEFMAQDDGRGSATPSALAAFEALLDRYADPPAGPFKPRNLPETASVSRWLETLEEARDPGDARRLALIAFAHNLHGRLLAIQAEPEAAQTAFGRAETLSAEAEPHPTFLGWRPPDQLEDRVRLDRLATLEAPPDTAGWFDQALGRLDTIDSERLASALLTGLSSREWIPPARLDAIRAEVHQTGIREISEYEPTAKSHRATPSLVVALADAHARAGRFSAADELLTELRQWVSARGQTRLSKEVQLGTLRLVTLARSDTRYQRTVRQVGGIFEPSEARATWTLGRITDSEHLLPDEEDAVWSVPLRHAWWRVQDDADLDDDQLEERALDLAAAGVDSRLDALEALAMLADRGVDPPAGLEVTVVPDELTTGEQVARGVLLDLVPLHRLDQVPDREAGWVLLEEGELLARRLPFMGVTALQIAETRFDRAGDPIGAFQAAVLVATYQEPTASKAGLVHRYEPFAAELERMAGEDRQWWAPWLDLYEAAAPAPPVTEAVADTLDDQVVQAPGSVEEPSTALPETPARRLEEPADKGPAPTASPVGRLISLVAVIGVAAGAVWAVQQAVQGITPYEPNYWQSWPIVVGLVAALFLVARGIVRLGRTFPAKVEIAGVDLRPFLAGYILRLESPEVAAGTTASKTPSSGGTALLAEIVRSGYRFAYQIIRIVGGIRRPAPIDLPSPGALPSEIRSSLLLNRKWAEKEPIPLRMIMPAAFARWAWEASFNSGWEAPGPWREPYQVWREIEGVGPGGRWASRDLNVVSAIVPPNWEIVVADGWEAHNLEVNFLDPGSRQVRRSSVLHLMGMPALTPDGWRLRLDDPGRITFQPTDEGKTRGIGFARDAGSQALVEPETLFQDDQPLTFVILQGTPVSGGAPTVSEELRLVAVDLLVAGAQAVLVIPQVGAPTAEALIGRLAEEAWDTGLAPERLLEITARLRQIAAAALPPDEPPPESASDARIAPSRVFDVCLFSRNSPVDLG